MEGIDARIVKFVKDENGNVLLKKLDNTLISSFNPAQNLLRIPEAKNKFKVQSISSFANNNFILDYTEVNCDLCEPIIQAQNFNDFLIELSYKFFFVENKGTVSSGGSSKSSIYGIIRPTFVYSNNFITQNSKFIRFQRIVGADYPTDITVEYGGFREGTLEPYTKPFYGGIDLDPTISVNWMSIESLYSIDDLFFRFSSSSYLKYFDVKLIVNPDSNTFSFMHANPLFVTSDADYNVGAVSDTLNLKLSTADNNKIEAFLRWKNVPELEANPE
ncbi:hypothetical protein C8C83_2825 [Flavobacterium sp. 90]|uniref:hypothetical protein n=1 Tax=unclassified Flavobacterium TaxID=196869 RepID=UPI000EB25645|nr:MULTISPECIES: hypothetical protein [unclassified Flavobacterium]RKR11128.1 hypothetical protein C8C82_3134 [Flavobacterium sp. 81]TCK54910.1 hypothetical protein C8C83_2825 [Flavobacterium sp. 90]